MESVVRQVTVYTRLKGGKENIVTCSNIERSMANAMFGAPAQCVCSKAPQTMPPEENHLTPPR